MMLANGAGEEKDDSSDFSTDAVRTVKVSNVSLGATLQDIKGFFSFCGDIEFVEMRSNTNQSQIAFVTFKDPQAAETALLLSGGIIVDLSVSVITDQDYQLPPADSALHLKTQKHEKRGSNTTRRKAEDVVTGMLAKGFVLGQDAVNKAKSFDNKHKLTSTALSKVASLDKKTGLSKKTSVGTSAMNDRAKKFDQKYQVSEKAKSAFAVAEKKVNSAGSAMMKNKHVFTGVSFVAGAFSKATKAVEDVGEKRRGKAGTDEEEQKRKIVD